MDPEEIDIQNLPRSDLIDLVKQLQEQISEDETNYRLAQGRTTEKISHMEHQIRSLEEIITAYERKLGFIGETASNAMTQAGLQRVYQDPNLVTVPFKP